MIGKPRLIVTSIIRYAGQEHASGFVRLLDIENKRVLMKSSVPECVFRSKDLNPRGGLRGVRGVSVHEDRLVIANTERLLIYDSKWMLTEEITHPLMSGIHDILAEEDGIWVTCTMNDLLLKVDWTGKIIADWEWRYDNNLIAEFGLRNLPGINRDLDYRNPETHRDGLFNTVHLNSVNRDPEGILLSFGRILSRIEYRKAKTGRILGKIAKSLGIKRRRNVGTKQRIKASIPDCKIEGSSSAIVLLREDNRTEILKRIKDISIPNHNVIKVENSLIYNDSNNSNVVVTELNRRGYDRKVKIPGKPGFVRGLAQLDKHTFFVGNQKPAAVYEVDLNTSQVLSTCPLDGEPNESVYGICIIPAEFNDPPTSLS